MTNKEYQEFTRNFKKYPKEKAISNIVLGLKDTLVSIRTILKSDNQQKKTLMTNWCGHLLFYLVRLIDELGLNLDDVIQTNYNNLKDKL